MKNILSIAIIACVTGTVMMVPGIAKAEVILVGSNQIQFNEITKTKLRDLYTGQSKLVGNTTVMVIDRLDEFSQKEHFISKTLGFTNKEFLTIQRLMECIGISTAPTMARDGKHMIELLAGNPNALGYLSREELQNHGTHSKLRFIKVLAE